MWSVNWLIAIIVVAVLLFYLFVQSNSDRKTGLVVKIYNDEMLWGSGIFYGISLFYAGLVSEYLIEVVACAIALWFFSSDCVPKWLKVMQKADAKAFMSVYFCMGIAFGPQVSLAFLCFSMLIANLTFMFYYHLVKREKVKLVSDVHKPYFPFITIGYAVCLITYLSVFLCLLG